MVKASLPPALVLAAVGLLSACNSVKDALEFADDRGDFEARRDALQSRSNTAYAGIPETGSATYTGEASLGLGTPSQGVVLIGDASITVDYGASEVSGELGNFGGYDNDKNYSDYGGVLTLDNGVLGNGSPNDVQAQINGTLTGNVYTIGVDALFEGHLKGTPIRGVLGDSTTSESTFELNGNEVTGGVVIAVN